MSLSPNSFSGCVCRWLPLHQCQADISRYSQGLAVIVQIIADILTPKEDEKALKSEATVQPRLSNLTVIILGEGLNGICSTLRVTLGTLGLASSTIGDGVALAFILYFIWLLYFDGTLTTCRRSGVSVLELIVLQASKYTSLLAGN